MIIGKFFSSKPNISIIFSFFLLVIAIPYAFSQEDINDPYAKQLEQEFNKLSPEHKNMMLQMVQEAAQKAFMEASPEEQESIIQNSQKTLREAPPEEQELIIQQMKQTFPPHLMEKIFPDEKK
jgi:hypothetical protein